MRSELADGLLRSASWAWAFSRVDVASPEPARVLQGSDRTSPLARSVSRRTWIQARTARADPSDESAPVEPMSVAACVDGRGRMTRTVPLLNEEEPLVAVRFHERGPPCE